MYQPASFTRNPPRRAACRDARRAAREPSSTAPTASMPTAAAAPRCRRRTVRHARRPLRARQSAGRGPAPAASTRSRSSTAPSTTCRRPGIRPSGNTRPHRADLEYVIDAGPRTGCARSMTVTGCRRVTALTQQQETGAAAPWAVGDAASRCLDKMLPAPSSGWSCIERLSGKCKLSQNQPAANRDSVIAGCRHSALPGCGDGGRGGRGA